MKKEDKKMKQGFFATFEGGEGSGKSTQIKNTYNWLISLYGKDRIVLTREPGGTPIAEEIRAIALKERDDDEVLHTETELLLMLAARSDHVRKVVLPALEAGKIVLCDRFYGSTFAYQFCARGLLGARHTRRTGFSELHELAAEVEPDLNILLDIDPEIGLRRVGKRGDASRIDNEGLDFHTKVREGFIYFFEHYLKRPQQYRKLDAAKSELDLFEEIKDKLIPRLPS